MLNRFYVDSLESTNVDSLDFITFKEDVEIIFKVCFALVSNFQ